MKKTFESVNTPATGTVATATARSSQKPRRKRITGRKTEGGLSSYRRERNRLTGAARNENAGSALRRTRLASVLWSRPWGPLLNRGAARGGRRVAAARADRAGRLPDRARGVGEEVARAGRGRDRVRPGVVARGEAAGAVAGGRTRLRRAGHRHQVAALGHRRAGAEVGADEGGPTRGAAA